MAVSRKSVLGYLALAAGLLTAQALFSQTALLGHNPPAVLSADVQIGDNQALRTMAGQLFALGNEARAAQGEPALEWDPALAAAALNHCARMAAEGPISHQYAGEPDLVERAGQAGARFSLIEENVAAGYEPASIHQAWMHSQGHRDNLLNPSVNRVGVAVVARGNMLYAVADFERAVATLTPEQVEAAVANLVRATGMTAHGDSSGARLACAQDHGLPASLDNRRPEFIMRWQAAELDRLPEALEERIATGRYHDAVVSSCASASADSSFTAYHVAVLLLKPESSASRTYLSSK